MNRLRFNLNGRWVEEPRLSPTTTLLRYLRDRLGLTGTKEGCAEGDCGACTVAVAEVGPNGAPQWRAVNACLLLLPMVQGKAVVTVEALRDELTFAYHPAQAALAEALGSQCGYCTPGVVMSLFEATYRDDLQGAPWKLDDQLCGNLCRCTGYRPIRAAAEAVAGTRPLDRFAAALPGAAPGSMELKLEVDGQRYFTPVRIGALWDLLDLWPEARLVAGGTDLALEVTKRFARPPLLVSLEGIAELRALTELPEGGYRLGAGATVSELEAWAAPRLPSLMRTTRYFGARQIKHRATIGGNLCTASPIGDLAPALISLGATAVCHSRAGARRLPLEELFVAYRKTALQPKEILAAVEVPRPSVLARAASYKVSKRRELDISTVAAAFLVEVGAGGTVVRARLAYGGMAATPRRAARAEAALLGQAWSAQAVEAAAERLGEDFTPLSDLRGSAGYRLKVAANLLRGFFAETAAAPPPPGASGG